MDGIYHAANAQAQLCDKFQGLKNPGTGIRPPTSLDQRLQLRVAPREHFLCPPTRRQIILSSKRRLTRGSRRRLECHTCQKLVQHVIVGSASDAFRGVPGANRDACFMELVASEAEDVLLASGELSTTLTASICWEDILLISTRKERCTFCLTDRFYHYTLRAESKIP